MTFRTFPLADVPGRLGELHRRYRWWPAAALVAALLTTGAVTDATSAAPHRASPPVSGAAPRPVVAPATPTSGSTVADPGTAAAAAPPAVGAGAGAPSGAASVTGAVRVMVAEYPLTYKPVAVSMTGAPRNPKSKPLVLPTRASAAVAFPDTPAQLRPTVTAPPAGPVPTLPAGGSPVAGSGTPVSNQAVYAMIQKYFPPAEWDRANRVSLCESGQRNVVSAPNFDGSRDYGVFQLNSAGTLPGLLSADGYAPDDFAMALDADWNVRAAVQLWQRRGWQPWTCAAKLGIVAGLWSSQPGPHAG